MLEKQLAAFTKQYNARHHWIGAFKDLLSRVLFYVTAINFVLLAVTAYHTTLGASLREWLPWFTLPVFIGVLVVLLLVSAVIEYKLILPSTIAYLNSQGYKHENPIRDQLDRIEKALADLQGSGKEKGKDVNEK